MRPCCAWSTAPTRWWRPTGRACWKKLGLAPDTLLERNPQLVVVRISGFGQTGPRSTQPGLGTLAEAYSGFASITGEPDGPPTLPPVALGDESAGLFATWALLAALYWRDARGGTGQVIDVSLFESLYSLLGPIPTLVKHLGYVPRRSGSRLSFSSPRNVYATSDGGWVALSGTAPSRAVLLLEALGGAELAADPRFLTAAGRQTHADDLDDLVADWVGRRTVEQVERELGEKGVAVSRVFSVAETFGRPPLRRPRGAGDGARHRPGRRHHAGPGAAHEPHARPDCPHRAAAWQRYRRGAQRAGLLTGRDRRRRPRRRLGRQPRLTGPTVARITTRGSGDITSTRSGGAPATIAASRSTARPPITASGMATVVSGGQQ